MAIERLVGHFEAVRPNFRTVALPAT